MSKILKQNGTDGKILRADQTGKVLKQNYNFAYAYNHKFPLELVDINITKLSGIWFAKKKINGGDTVRLYTYNTTGSSFSFAPMAYGGTNFYPCRGEINTVLKTGNAAWYNPNIQAPPFSRSCNFMWDGNSKSINGYNIAGALQQNTYTEDIINSVRLFIDSNTSGNILSSYLVLYNRDISFDDWVYIHNNLLGNDPLNLNLIFGFYKFDNAEIIDSAIKIRDFSVNDNHLTINNLPAGTLQEQLDYANANLFEAW